MKLRNMDLVAIDFETTGDTPGHPCLPWQIGIAAVIKGKVAPEYCSSAYLRVPEDQPFNQYAPGRWGEIREQLAVAPTLPELWQSLAPFITGRYLLAHNAPTERRMLRQAFPVHNFDLWADTLKLAKRAYPGLRSYALGDLLEQLELTAQLEHLLPGLAAHDALYDAAGCAILFQHIISLPEWSDLTTEQL